MGVLFFSPQNENWCCKNYNLYHWFSALCTLESPRVLKNSNAYCLSLLGLLLQNTTACVAYKQQIFISHSSEGCKSKIRVPVWLGEFPLTGYRLPIFVCSHGGRGWGSLWSFFYKRINPINECFTFMIKWFPKAPLPNTITSGISIWVYEFWRDTNI